MPLNIDANLPNLLFDKMFIPSMFQVSNVENVIFLIIYLTIFMGIDRGKDTILKIRNHACLRILFNHLFA